MNRYANTLRRLVLLLLIGGSFSPVVVFAASHSYTSCGDWDVLVNGITCSGSGVLQASIGGNNEAALDYVAPGFSTGLGTYYFYGHSLSGTTGSISVGIEDSVGVHTGSCSVPAGSGAFTCIVNASGFTSPTEPTVRPDIYGGVSATDGTINDLCISDTALAECGYGSPPPPITADYLGTALSAASSSMQAITGWDILGVLEWSKSNIFGLFTGGSIAILGGFKDWLAAIAIIGSALIAARWAMKLFFRY